MAAAVDRREFNKGPQLTVRDLMKYVAGSKLDPGVRDEINRQVNIVGSPVQRWVAEFDAKIRQPLALNWGMIAAEPDVSDKEQSRGGDAATE